MVLRSCLTNLKFFFSAKEVFCLKLAEFMSKHFFGWIISDDQTCSITAEFTRKVSAMSAIAPRPDVASLDFHFRGVIKLTLLGVTATSWIVTCSSIMSLFADELFCYVFSLKNKKSVQILIFTVAYCFICLASCTDLFALSCGLCSL